MMNTATLPRLGCFDQGEVLKEHALFGDYLSGDLETILAAAAIGGEAMFTALATAKVEKRREAALKWRGKALQVAASIHARLREGANHLPAEFLRDAFEGKVALSKFESEALSALQVATQAKLDRKRAAFGGIREHIRALHCGDDGKARDTPSDMVILQDGKVSFHTSTKGAKIHGQASGMAFFYCRIDRASGRFFELPDGPCAGEELLKGGGSCGCPGSTAPEADAPKADAPETSPASLDLPLSDSGKAPESPESPEKSETPFPGE